MSPIKRILRSVKKQGLGLTFVKFYGLFSDWFFDLRYGVDTSREHVLDALTIPGENRRHGTPYVPARIIVLRRLFRMLRPFVSRGSVLVDIGSGKGRVLFVASEFGFKEARGIEFAHELSAAACQNSASYTARTRTHTRFDIIETDATTYPIQPDEDVFFLNNPFDRTILARVLENIHASLRQYPREVSLLYFTPSEKAFLDADACFKRVKSGQVYGYDYILYRNGGGTTDSLNGFHG